MEYTEKEINLKELLVYVMYKWKRILKPAIVLAVILGIYQAVAGTLALNANMKAYELAYADYQTNYSIYETQKNALEQQLKVFMDALEDPQDPPSSYIDTIANIQESIDSLVVPSMANIEKPSMKVVVKDTISYAGGGFVLGAGLVCFYYVFLFCVDGKIHSKEELVGFKYVRLLGSLVKESAGNTKRKKSKIDAWIDKFAERDDEISYEEAQKILGLNIEVHGLDADNIVLTGSVGWKYLYEIEKVISAVTEDKTYVVQKNISRNSEAFKAVLDNDAVILVEKVGKSKYKDIDETIEFVESLGKKVIGCILV